MAGRSDSEKMVDRYWAPDPEMVYAPCCMRSVDAKTGRATFLTEDAKEIVVTSDQLRALHRVTEQQLEGVDDICTLPQVSEGAMLHTVRVRYNNHNIYTRVAKVLIAVNPFSALPIYSSAQLDTYAKASDTSVLAPHIFGLSQDALQGLRDQAENNVVLIGGESGAGKTESAKLILSFVAEAAKGDETSIKEKILRTSPIFESFGNAMTVRNNNSSRFGKLLEIRFSPAMHILDCVLTQYLLETTRVCSHSKGERSYHIFYQLVQARSKFPELRLGDLQSYRYCQFGEQTAPGINDAYNFEETLEALGLMGFSREEQIEIFRVIAGLLNMGNCEFREGADGQASELVDDKPVTLAAELLGVPVADLRHCMLFKTITVGGAEIETNIPVGKCPSVRDTLSQMIYGRMFEWLVLHMNEILASPSKANDSERKLGILDIAGFESFEHNSLEQLLINLANEHLQQSFSFTVVKSELEDYVAEGVSIDVKFTDNSDILDLLDGKEGVFDKLDEECNLPKGTDAGYVSKLVKARASHSRLVPAKFGGSVKFGVKHFAGEVTYSCEGFLEKNQLKLPDAAGPLLSNSSVGVLRRLGQAVDQDQAQAEAKRTAAARMMKKPKTASKGFRESLKQLTGKISQSHRHYIRCVKPNKEKKPNLFTSQMVFEQLLFSGILEAIHVRQQGYSLRLPFAEFAARYRCVIEILGPPGTKVGSDVQKIVKLLPKVVGDTVANENIVIGNTKVFVKTKASVDLDKGRERALVQFAIKLQAASRRMLARKKAKRLKKANNELKESLRQVGMLDAKSMPTPVPNGCVVDRFKSREAAAASRARIESDLRLCADLSFDNYMVKAAVSLERRIDQELEILNALDSVSESLDAVEIDKATARARALNVPIPAALTSRCKKLQVQLPLVQAMRDILDSSGVQNVLQKNKAEDAISNRLAEIVRTVEATGLTKKPQDWMQELKGAELFAQISEKHQEIEDARQKLAEQKLMIQQEADRLRTEAESKAAEEKQRKEEEAAREAQGKALRRRSVAFKERAGRRQTITGLSGDQQDKLLEELREAVDDLDADRLESLLRQATMNCVNNTDLAPSRLMFQQLQSEAFVVEAIKEAEDEARQEDPSARTIRRLHNLAIQVRRLRGDEEMTRLARRSVAAALSRKTTAAKFKPDSEEQKLHEETFDDLSYFSGLKSLKMWRGHRRASVTLSRVQPDGQADKSEEMLSHSNCTISEALTRVPETCEAAAVQNFRDILIFCGDRQAQDCQRFASQQAILGVACSSEAMSDEAFVQVMKQLRNNPWETSKLRCWQLLQALCCSVTPTGHLVEFLKAFLAKEQAAGDEKISAICRKCLDALAAYESLAVMRGHLWKRSPAKLRFSSFDWRFFEVRHMHIFWWKTFDDAATPEAAGPDGGPLCKGNINLLAEECVLEPDENSPTVFCLRAKDRVWAREAISKSKTKLNRVFHFDTNGSEYDRQQWMAGIQAHLDRAASLRDASVPQQTTIRKSEQQQSASGWRVGDTAWYRGLCNLLPDGTELMYGAKGSVVRVAEGEEKSRIAMRFQDIKYTITCKPSELDTEQPSTILAGGWKVGDIAFYKNASNVLPSGAEVKYGAEGKVVGPSKLGDGKDNDSVALRLDGVKESVSIFVQELSREPPVQKLAGDLQLDEVVYWKGRSMKFPNGSELLFATQGKIMGPDLEQPNSVAVRFPLVQINVLCHTNDLTRTKPQPQDEPGAVI